MQESNTVNGNIKQFHIGSSNAELPTKKLIFVGETGSGKTTLVNTMVNNIFHVSFSDDFRYSVCELDNKKRSESESQTDFVTEYIFYGTKSKFVIVDTPGLGDTRGVQMQKENMQRILMYCNNQTSNATLALVIHSSANRLTAEIKSMLLDMKKLEKTENIQSLIIMSTFADNDSPSVKDVLDGFSIPYTDLCLFNNNALYSKNQGIPDDDLFNLQLNWNISHRSIDRVLNIIGTDIKAEEKIINNDSVKEDYCSVIVPFTYIKNLIISSIKQWLILTSDIKP